MDGYARLGKVLITDTNLDYPANIPDAVPVRVGTLPPRVCTAGNLSDVQIETAPPFDSHTWGGFAINDPCTSFYVGREGQLVVPWEDDLHLGYVSTHEMMHYAFNAPDLYNITNPNQTAPVANDNQSWCRNEAWDGSVMHNSGGWSGLKWTLTELDRNPVTTPCDHEGKPYTWDVLRAPGAIYQCSRLAENRSSRKRNRAHDRHPGSRQRRRRQARDFDSRQAAADGVVHVHKLHPQ